MAVAAAAAAAVATPAVAVALSWLHDASTSFEDFVQHARAATSVGVLVADSARVSGLQAHPLAEAVGMAPLAEAVGMATGAQ